MSQIKWKATKTENPNFRCSECKSNEIEYRIVEDQDCHEDIKYHCTNCDKSWWSEGSDY